MLWEVEHLMNRGPIYILGHSFLLAVLGLAAAAQTGSNRSAPQPVPYTSVNEVNQLLARLEQVSQSAQVDLAKLRIERWKTDANTKQQTLGNIESITRNLHTALPDMTGAVRNSPADLDATFKLYRNLNALYDVFSSVVEAAGAFGSRDDFQALSNDLNVLETSRHSFGDRVETLASAKDAELNSLRTQLRNMQAQAPIPAPPKKVIVDDTEPPKKSAKKKSAPKPPSNATSPAKNTQPSTTPAPQSQNQQQ